MTNLAIASAVLLALVVAGLAIWLIPRWQVQGWRRAGISGDEKLAELELQARTGITQALGGLALIVTIAITANQAIEANSSARKTQESADKNLALASKNLQLAEQGQVSERYLKAVEQLGAGASEPAIDVRTGALFSLRQIGLDSSTYLEPAFVVVARYIRNNYRPPNPLPHHGCDRFRLPRADVAAALTSILPAIAHELRQEKRGRQLLGLRGGEFDGLDLDGLILNRFNLTGIKLRAAHLSVPAFRHSTLLSADLEGACLRGADFRAAILQGANLRSADLSGADFRGARNLNTTNFARAQVAHAKFTKQALEQTSLSEAQRSVIDVFP